MSTPLSSTPLAPWGSHTARLTLPSRSVWSDEASLPFARNNRSTGHDSMVNDVIDLTCGLADVSREDLVGPRRWRPLLQPRAAAYVAIRVLSGDAVSYPALGRAFGRDHTTVMHAVQHCTPLGEEMAEEIIEAYEAAMERPRLRVVGE